jgi:hypothetical protein
MANQPSSRDLSEDFVLVYNHVLEHWDQYAIRAPDGINAALFVRLSDEGFHYTEGLSVVLAWVRSLMRWKAKRNLLTAEERAIAAAVERLEDFVELYALIPKLGHAIDAKDWPMAREIWKQLEPYHALMERTNPETKELATVLRNQEAITKAAERQSSAIH